MKNFKLLIPAILIAVCAFSQSRQPYAAFKWAPAGLILGNVSVLGEYSFGKKSLTAKIGIPVTTRHTLTYDDRDASFNMRATSFLAGYRTYLSKKQLRGLYLEPFFKYVHHSSEGTGHGWVSGNNVEMEFTNEYNGVGLGLQLGTQFIISKRLIIDLYLIGPELNSARNTFKGKETTSYLPWTNFEANEVENDVRDFIDQFPFIRKRTNVMVDSYNKTVTANFKGALPGIRAGIAFGLAF